MARMFKLGFGEAFVVVDHSIADELDLWDAGDSFKVWVENGFLGAFCLIVSMSVVL